MNIADRIFEGLKKVGIRPFKKSGIKDEAAWAPLYTRDQKGNNLFICDVVIMKDGTIEFKR